MPRTGRPKAELTLTDEERGQLVRWARRRKSSQALALRSRVVLGCADGLDNKTVAAQLGGSAATVGKWRARFVEHRLDGLTEEYRPGRPPVISADQVEDVVVATLESTPANATHWSRAKMAERTGLSKSTIGGSSDIRWGVGVESAGDQEHPEPVVLAVSVAACDAAVQFDEAVEWPRCRRCWTARW